MKKFEKVVPDTSIIIEGVLSEKIGKEIQVDEVVIHNAVVAELEHQANEERAMGYLGIDELKALKALADKGKIILSYKGKKPTYEIKYASLGEIDSLIRELAYEEGATLVSGDKIQARIAEVKGIPVEYYAKKLIDKKLLLDNYFDKETMSVHLKEAVEPYAKKGFPGNWQFVKLENKTINQELLQDISREIIEEAKKRKDSFIEIERPGSTIVQLGHYRIVILRPPFSDGWEITAVRPVKKLRLEEYNLSEKLKERFESHAEGVLIAGAPGHGKTTFASALAVHYAEKGKIVKTIEAPRDLVLPENVTQLAMSHGDEQEIHDIMLLTRPDYTFFDEMRNTKDFLLYADLRLSGVGLVGVMHATKSIDAIQRFVGRIELGVIPHVIDTVVFIKNGTVAKVLSLEMTVKVPSGMMEADLARPVVTVSDFETGKLEVEIYSYGEETVVIPVSDVKEVEHPLQKLAAREIERSLYDYAKKVKVVMVSDNRAEVYVPSENIARIIGKEGKTVSDLEKQFGVRLDIKELTEKPTRENSEKENVKYDVSQSGGNLNIFLPREHAEQEAEIHVDGRYLLTAAISKKGVIKIKLGSKIGQTLANDLRARRKVEVRV